MLCFNIRSLLIFSCPGSLGTSRSDGSNNDSLLALLTFRELYSTKADEIITSSFFKPKMFGPDTSHQPHAGPSVDTGLFLLMSRHNALCRCISCGKQACIMERFGL